ncbi:hypothetical protein EYF80_038882 [Liparis tanakae]|uniref:Uncharacterized protein n=1 Tax=Liparis tanakae TaxID=230148 RepID=A0A4Z2GCD5_9TELE|nr:hypothetical protein EYF80_038882 [Liparis tanakae]
MGIPNGTAAKMCVTVLQSGKRSHHSPSSLQAEQFGVQNTVWLQGGETHHVRMKTYTRVRRKCPVNGLVTAMTGSELHVGAMDGDQLSSTQRGEIETSQIKPDHPDRQTAADMNLVSQITRQESLEINPKQFSRVEARTRRIWQTIITFGSRYDRRRTRATDSGPLVKCLQRGQDGRKPKKGPLKTKNATERLEEIGNQTRRRGTDAQRRNIEEIEKTGQGAESFTETQPPETHMINFLIRGGQHGAAICPLDKSCAKLLNLSLNYFHTAGDLINGAFEGIYMATSLAEWRPAKSGQERPFTDRRVTTPNCLRHEELTLRIVAGTPVVLRMERVLSQTQRNLQRKAERLHHTHPPPATHLLHAPDRHRAPKLSSVIRDFTKRKIRLMDVEHYQKTCSKVKERYKVEQFKLKPRSRLHTPDNTGTKHAGRLQCRKMRRVPPYGPIFSMPDVAPRER